MYICTTRSMCSLLITWRGLIVFAILFAIFGLKMTFYSVNPKFHYIRSENMHFWARISENLDSFVRYFCQKLDYHPLKFWHFGLEPKIVRYWSFVIGHIACTFAGSKLMPRLIVPILEMILNRDWFWYHTRKISWDCLSEIYRVYLL